MLIYNFQKEFFGIDAADLQALGYNDLSALRAEATDIADLFVKTPGYIHNFKHVHWIDFLACSDPSEVQKVIIHANGKHFRATLSVTNAYLIENASSKAYLVYLNNLHQLSDHEIDTLQDDLPNQASPSIPTQAPIHELKDTTPPVYHESKPEIKEEVAPAPEPQPIPKVEPVPTFVPEPQVPDDDFKIDIDFEETQTQKAPEPYKEKFDNGYIYDPALASRELGLPVDLIEEFIQDFIAQADDFKPELYSSLQDGDIDNVKSLSHKLKGVAANLRIEDAFETLSIINTTSDTEVIKTNLDLFYKIMAKLAGVESEEDVIEDVIEEVVEEVKGEEELVQDETIKDDKHLDTDDEFMLDFKEDEHIDDLTLGFKDDFISEPKIEKETAEETQEEIKEEALESETIELVSEPEIELEVEPEVEVLYSKTKIANEIGLDQESFNELFNDYIQEGFLILEELKKSLQDDNLSEIRIDVSKLRGMSDNMRVNDFNEELQHLMHATEHQERSQAVQKIEAIMKKLSEQGE